ncbi:MAG: ABC transporter ATP-binding protein [Paludibacteraceae bacterium]|nr:ABC transporter ATP-binding protein [Paludibacteraceae bacterium]
MPTLSDNNIAIKVNELSKTYSIKNDKGREGIIYALNNVSFEIKKGEVIGIIGPNGSGKSTLLKIISEITAPTSGSVEICGHVASILEVGTGFNPDLSGRKNIYLNARLHGMKKAEVDVKFNDIVELFGFSDFLDTPVKQYSSGMYMRLAFAVVVHLDADIYLFDEVLSVGDAEFRRRVLNILEKLKIKNKTVLVVTHNPDLIYNISNNIIVLNKGLLDVKTEPKHAIIQYLKKQVLQTTDEQHSMQACELYNLKQVLDPKINTDFELLASSLSNKNKISDNIIKSKYPIDFEFEYETFSTKPITIVIIMRDYKDNMIASYYTEPEAYNKRTRIKRVLTIPAHTLNNLYVYIDIVVTQDEKPTIIYPKIIAAHIKNEEKNSNAGYFNLNIFTKNALKN